jgi:hypothetical protein
MEHLKGASLGEATGLPANIRLGWINLTGTNTSLLQKFLNYGQKSFITLAPGDSDNSIFVNDDEIVAFQA